MSALTQHIPTWAPMICVIRHHNKNVVILPRYNSRTDTALLTTSGAVITGVVGMFFTANQLGKRIEDATSLLGKRIDDSNNSLGKRIDDLRSDVKELRVEVKELRSEFYTFKEVVNGKFQALDFEIAKLMDRQKPH